MRVAVIGAGSVGLVALKNFAEEGLEVVGFEKEGQVGGLWVWNEDESVTSALPCTRANWSKHRMCTSDFPHLPSVSLHPDQQELADWHQRYAEHFDLLRHIYFSTTVHSIDLVAPATDGSNGKVEFEVIFAREGSEEKERSIVVDKVFIATGFHSVPFVPEVDGMMDTFRGVVKHSQAFKSGDAFKDKKVVVVGSRSSASDVCQTLVESGASQVYLSHRAGVLVVPRVWWGKPMSSIVTRRLQGILNVLDSILPHTSARIQNLLLKLASPRLSKLDKAWKFEPFLDNSSSVPTISDVIVPMLQSGKIISVPSLCSSPSPHTLELSDGQILTDIDAVIFATGYQGTPINTLLGPAILARITPRDGPQGRPEEGFTRLYKEVMVPELPEMALSVQGYAAEGVIPYTDLRMMWLAGVWAGQIPLASREEMWEDVKKHEEWFKGFYKFTPTPTPGAFALGPFLNFIDAQLGSEIALHTSWFSLAAWGFYFSSFPSNARLVSKVLDGVATPAVYRLWGRKEWEGARQCVEEANM